MPLVEVEEEKEENSGGGAQYSTCERQQLLYRKREAARALGGANGQHALTPTQQIRCERESERRRGLTHRAQTQMTPDGMKRRQPTAECESVSVYVFTQVLFFKKKKCIFIFFWSEQKNKRGV